MNRKDLLRLSRRAFLLTSAVVVIALAAESAEAYRRRRPAFNRDWRGALASQYERYRPYSPASDRIAYRPRHYQPVSYEPPRERRAPEVTPPIERQRQSEPILPVAGQPMSEQQAYRFEREYAYRQSQSAMEGTLGTPDLRTWNEAKWKIRRVGHDGRENGKFGYLRVKYDLSGHVVERNFEW